MLPHCSGCLVAPDRNTVRRVETQTFCVTDAKLGHTIIVKGGSICPQSLTDLGH